MSVPNYVPCAAQRAFDLEMLRWHDQFYDPPQFFASRQWIFELQRTIPAEDELTHYVRQAFANGA